MLTRMSPRFQVGSVELIGGAKGRDFVLYAEDGTERFSARLMDGSQTLSIAWTDNIPRLGLRLRETQQLAGGVGSFDRIVGMASDSLEQAVRAGTFDADHAARLLDRTLGGRWAVAISTRSEFPDLFDIEARLKGE